MAGENRGTRHSGDWGVVAPQFVLLLTFNLPIVTPAPQTEARLSGRRCGPGTL